MTTTASGSSLVMDHPSIQRNSKINMIHANQRSSLPELRVFYTGVSSHSKALISMKNFLRCYRYRYEGFLSFR